MWGTKVVALLIMFAVSNSQQDLLALLTHTNIQKNCGPSNNYCKAFLLDSLKMTELDGFIHANFPYLGSIKNIFTFGQKDVSQERG